MSKGELRLLKEFSLNSLQNLLIRIQALESVPPPPLPPPSPQLNREELVTAQAGPFTAYKGRVNNTVFYTADSLRPRLVEFWGTTQGIGIGATIKVLLYDETATVDKNPIINTDGGHQNGFYTSTWWQPTTIGDIIAPWIDAITSGGGTIRTAFWRVIEL